jgi:glycosyltransferase involved in cell wall biosynthesis
MEIACVVRRSFPGPGGIASALRVTTRELARRHDVRVWAARIDAEPLTRLNATLGAQVFPPMWSDGVEVRPIPMGIGGLAAATPMALMRVPGLRSFGYEFLRKATAPGYVRLVGARLAADWGAPDLVHCWGGEHLNWAAGHAARAGGIPFAVTPFAHPKAWGDDPMNVEFYRTAQVVLALLPSEAVFYASLGIPEERLRVVGVPVAPASLSGPDVRAQHRIGNEPLVLYLGVKEPYKGYRTLLEAAPAIWAESPRARIAFVGPRTKASEADFGAVDDVRVIEAGHVSEEEVASWLRAATVLCLPSTSEIMPVVILEAWRAGVPVVAARWWCAPDLIEHERDGLIVEPDSAAVAAALVSLLRDPAGARAMGETGRAKTVELYSPEAVAALHESAYADAIRA